MRDSLWICNTCLKGRTDEARPSGQCFACHIKGIGFNFVGGGGYGRKNFHDHTTAEVIRANFEGAAAAGTQPEYAGSSWYAGPT